MKINMLVILIAALMHFPGMAAGETENIVFIVHAENPVSEITMSDIRDYYFKRKRQWPHGESVRFIDRAATNPPHEIFLKTILKQTKSKVELFWIGQKLYTGDSAPLRESTDHATIQFVSFFKGAIGYVSSATDLTEKKVKTIKVVRSGED